MDSTGKTVEARTIKAEPASEACDLERILRLAGAVAEQAAYMLRRHVLTGEDILSLVLISIEYPIMNAGNVTNYRKQINTLFAIEHELVRSGTGNYLIEVNPTESKLVVTGSGAATKADIIAASPFTGSGHTIETMADAWMHAVCGHKLAKLGAHSCTSPLCHQRIIDMNEIKSWPYKTHAIEELK